MSPGSSKKIVRWFVILLITLNFAIIVKVLLPKPVSYNGKTVFAWMMELNDNDQKKRDDAERAFKQLGARAVPDLIAALGGKDSRFRKIIFTVSPKLPSFARGLLARVVKPINWPLQHMLAARALGMIGSEAKDAIPALDEALHEKDESVATDAATALGKIGKVSVPILIQDLQDKSSSVRQKAGYALGLTGTNATPAIPALVERLGDSNDYVRISAGSTLGIIGEAAAPAIIQVIEKGVGAQRRAALFPATRIFPSKQFVQSILEMLSDSDAQNRRDAAMALTVIKPGSKEVVTAMMLLLREPDPKVRLEAITVLKMSPTMSRTAVSMLTEFLSDSDKQVREAARETLEKINSIPVLQSQPK